MAFLSDRLRTVVEPGRGRGRRSREARPAVEALDGRILLASMVSDQVPGGIDGIGAGGVVVHYDATHGWTQIGQLQGAVAVVASRNTFGQDELFAETGDGSLWTYEFAAPMLGKVGTGQWLNTGGRLVFSTVIATMDGITGVAGGGTVWHYQDDGGWSQIGTLGGVASVVQIISPSGPPEFFAETGDGSIWVSDSGSGPWLNTGGRLEPGTMIPVYGGIDGVAGGGTVWGYSESGGWSQLAGLSGVTSVITGSIYSQLFAQTGDGSIWAYQPGTGASQPGGWLATGGRLVPSTMTSTVDGIAGIAGGGTVWEYKSSWSTNKPGWSEEAGLGGVVSLVEAYNDDPGAVSVESFVQLGDGSVWYFSARGQWVNTARKLVLPS